MVLGRSIRVQPCCIAPDDPQSSSVARGVGKLPPVTIAVGSCVSSPDLFALRSLPSRVPLPGHSASRKHFLAQLSSCRVSPKLFEGELDAETHAIHSTTIMVTFLEEIATEELGIAVSFFTCSESKWVQSGITRNAHSSVNERILSTKCRRYDHC